MSPSLIVFVHKKQLKIKNKQFRMADQSECRISTFMSGSCHLDRLSNVEIGVEIQLFIYSFVFCLVKKKKKYLWNFCIKIAPPFLYLEGAPKLISREQFKNTTTKIFKIQHKFCHSTTCPNDMIQTLD